MRDADIEEIHTLVIRLESRVDAMEVVLDTQRSMTDYLTRQMTGLTDRLEQMREMLARTDSKLADVQAAMLGAFHAHEVRENEETGRTLAYRAQRAEDELQYRAKQERADKNQRRANYIAVAGLIMAMIAAAFDHFVLKS